MRISLITGSALVLAATTSPASATCLSYAHRALLTGTLTRTVFPGLPNQKPEAYFVLQMNPPACVDADPTAPTEMPGMRNIRGIQLLLVPEQYDELRPKLGQRIGLSGVLFPAETGHHHTPVILEKVEFGR